MNQYHQKFKLSMLLIKLLAKPINDLNNPLLPAFLVLGLYQQVWIELFLIFYQLPGLTENKCKFPASTI